MSDRIYKYKDIDPKETQEWLDAIDNILSENGEERARYLLKMMIDYAERKGDRMFINTRTPYINTIQHFEEPEFPGNRKIEKKIKSDPELKAAWDDFEKKAAKAEKSMDDLLDLY